MLRRSALLVAVSTFLTTACGGGAGQEAQQIIPDLTALTLEVTGDPSEGAAAPTPQQGAIGISQRAVTHAPEYLAHARDGVRMVNATVKEMMGQVRSLIEQSEGRQTAAGRVYGPKDVGTVTYRVLVRKLGEGSFGWRLEAKPQGAQDSAYLRVMAGGVQRRGESGRRGTFGANLDNMKAIDASYPGQGLLLGGFGLREGNKTLAYRLRNFTPDAQEHRPVTAAFVGHRRADTGATSVRLATHQNLARIPNGTAAEELVRLRARWVPGVGGRAAILATAGDIPQGEAYVGTSCWDAQLQEGFKALLHCTQVGTPSRSCTVIQSTGQQSSCRSGERDVAEPALDPMDGALDSDAPDTGVTAPTEEPTGEQAG